MDGTGEGKNNISTHIFRFLLTGSNRLESERRDVAFFCSKRQLNWCSSLILSCSCSSVLYSEWQGWHCEPATFLPLIHFALHRFPLHVVLFVCFSACFVFATPFTPSGKAHASSITDQWKRRTYLTVPQLFPGSLLLRFYPFPVCHCCFSVCSFVFLFLFPSLRCLLNASIPRLPLLLLSSFLLLLDCFLSFFFLIPPCLLFFTLFFPSYLLRPSISSCLVIPLRSGVRCRQPVISRRTLSLSPIEVAIEDILVRCRRLFDEIHPKIGGPDLKTITQVQSLLLLVTLILFLFSFHSLSSLIWLLLFLLLFDFNSGSIWFCMCTCSRWNKTSC